MEEGKTFVLTFNPSSLHSVLLNPLFPLQRGHHGVGEGKDGRGTSSPKPHLERGASFNTFCTTHLLLNASRQVWRCSAKPGLGTGQE